MPQAEAPLDNRAEGDQALIHAADMLPEGERRLDHDDGTHTRVYKTEGPDRVQVVAEVSNPDGSTEQASTLIKSAPGDEVVSADIAKWPADKSKIESEQAVGDLVNGELAPQPDRKRAEAIKLDVAKRIGNATQRLAERRVEDPELAREMADAEKPHRDDIAERKKEVALKKENANRASIQLADGKISEGAATERSQQAAMLDDVSRRANERDLREAEAAAERVREQHETREAA
jgi:hypothetical protein